ncbi:MAG TPA: hypothetical protein VIM65_05880 [Cyclobacteriaceae bacterium]
MPVTIKDNETYYLDGKLPVTVIKALNPSRTYFSIQKIDGGIESVEAERLHVEAKNMYEVIMSMK